jgi:hypothetical protein
MRLFGWIIFGGVVCWVALTWNGDEVESIFMKVAFFFHDLFVR